MNEILELVLANSFSGVHKSKIICSVKGQSQKILVSKCFFFIYQGLLNFWSVYVFLTNISKIH
jgi:hypothetical protein